MSTPDFFRSRLDTMIDLRHPLAVLATRMPWASIEATLAPMFERRVREGRICEQATASRDDGGWDCARSMRVVCA